MKVFECMTPSSKMFRFSLGMQHLASQHFNKCQKFILHNFHLLLFFEGECILLCFNALLFGICPTLLETFCNFFFLFCIFLKTSKHVSYAVVKGHQTSRQVLTPLFENALLIFLHFKYAETGKWKFWRDATNKGLNILSTKSYKGFTLHFF